MTDNGSEFTAYTGQKTKKSHVFETVLKIFEIKRRCSLPYLLQTNGKIERFWKILLYEECLRLQTISPSKEDFIAELNGSMYRYNYQRRHGALDYITPLDKLKSFTEIMK